MGTQFPEVQKVGVGESRLFQPHDAPMGVVASAVSSASTVVPHGVCAHGRRRFRDGAAAKDAR